jgi:biotin transport system substrate-specific component
MGSKSRKTPPVSSSVKGENPKSPIHLPPTLEFLWAVIGLLLTVGCTFLKASIASPFWDWWPSGIHTQSLGVTFQIGAVLLTGCMGGKNAGALSQIAYLVLGLTGMQVFDGGGGFGYLAKPTFGYLLGFVPGAWVCGWLAFQTKRRLEFLALSCMVGLLMIHLAGLSALALKYSFQEDLLLPAALTYSVDPLPSQMAVVCAVTVLAFVLRLLMFY